MSIVEQDYNDNFEAIIKLLRERESGYRNKNLILRKINILIVLIFQ